MVIRDKGSRERERQGGGERGKKSREERITE